MHRVRVDLELGAVMRITKFLFIATLGATLGLTSAASAETPRLTAVREGLRELEARAKAIRAQAAQSNPAVREESERIVSSVDAQRVFLATRLDLFDMVGRSDSVDEGTVREIEAKYSSTARLLAVVEGWFRPR
jgi:hypothetical protein